MIDKLQSVLLIEGIPRVLFLNTLTTPTCHASSGAPSRKQRGASGQRSAGAGSRAEVASVRCRWALA